MVDPTEIDAEVPAVLHEICRGAEDSAGCDVVEGQVLIPEGEAVVELNAVHDYGHGGGGRGERRVGQHRIIDERDWRWMLPSSRTQSSVAQSIQLYLGESIG